MPRAQLNLEKPTPLQLEELQWIIITSENAEEVFKKLEEKGIDPVLWGLTDKDFELLAINYAIILKQLKITKPNGKIVYRENLKGVADCYKAKGWKVEEV